MMPPASTIQPQTTITLTGQGFTNDTQVLFGAFSSPRITFVSATELRVNDVVEVSTGEFWAEQRLSDHGREELKALLARLRQHDQVVAQRRTLVGPGLQTSLTLKRL